MSSQNHITTFPATYHVPQDWIFQSGISNYQVQSIGTRGRVKFSLPFRGIQFKLVYILAIWFCNKNYLLASLLVVKSDKSLKGRIKTLLEYLTVWNERLGNELGGLLSLLLNNQESTMPLQISINTDSRGTGQYTECYWRGWVQQHTRGMHAYMLFFKKNYILKKITKKSAIVDFPQQTIYIQKDRNVLLQRKLPTLILLQYMQCQSNERLHRTYRQNKWAESTPLLPRQVIFPQSMSKT